MKAAGDETVRADINPTPQGPRGGVRPPITLFHSLCAALVSLSLSDATHTPPAPSPRLPDNLGGRRVGRALGRGGPGSFPPAQDSGRVGSGGQRPWFFVRVSSLSSPAC